jgi:hypothetical protein
MYKSLITFILAAILCFAAPAAAVDIQLGDDTYGLDSFYDVRTYHESHPDYGKMRHRGGWAVSMTYLGDFGPNVRNVVFDFDAGPEGNTMTVDYTSPMVYNWGGVLNHDFHLMLGSHYQFGGVVTATAYDQDGSPINVIHWDESIGNMGSTLSITIPKDLPTPPIPEIKKIVLLANGKTRVKFMFPYDENFTNIRFRIFEDPSVGTGMEKEYRLNADGSRDPQFLDVMKDGVPVEDKLKIIVPAEYQGRTGRIEYRTSIDGYMLRGIQYFKLPVPEVE